jgi:Pyruvate/2-oxoacid:ferredoxin oxidoreductase delta subunit
MKAEHPYHYIDQSLCVGCGQCVTLCPMNAIHLEEGKASIDRDECAECGVCTRSRVCAVDAIRAGELSWPRTLRSLYSNPLAKHKGTQVYGRGTEETKTNDSQNLYGPGFIGVVIELGRPVLGARFSDVEQVVKKFASRGHVLPPSNPVMALVADPGVGSLKPEILQEKVISCIVEFILPESAAGELMSMLRELDQEVKTVFNVCVGIRADEAGRPRLKELFGPDIHSLPQVKVNVGMARGIREEYP